MIGSDSHKSRQEVTTICRLFSYGQRDPHVPTFHRPLLILRAYSPGLGPVGPEDSASPSSSPREGGDRKWPVPPERPSSRRFLGLDGADGACAAQAKHYRGQAKPSFPLKEALLRGALRTFLGRRDDRRSAFRKEDGRTGGAHTPSSGRGVWRHAIHASIAAEGLPRGHSGRYGNGGMTLHTKADPRRGIGKASSHYSALWHPSAARVQAKTPLIRLLAPVAAFEDWQSIR